MAIGDNIRLLRRNMNLTQQALADKTGIPVRTIVNYENSNREPNAKSIAILERFFGISGECLRNGNLEDSQIRPWDDAEIMEAVRESLPGQLRKLHAILKDSSNQEQKLVFDILGELAHVLKLPDAAQRSATISLLEGVFAASIRYADVCIGAVQDIDFTRMEKAKKTALSQYDAALDEVAFFRPD